jgi:ADP-ribose pyrophosphatase YjhB (NUDIX family)
VSDRPEVCVGAVAVAGDRLLLVRRGREPGRGLWSVPGGRVEAGESLVEAVERELLEETGVVARCGPLLGVAERRDGDHHFVILDYLVEVPEAVPLVPGTDADEAAWVPLAEVTERPLVTGLAGFLAANGVLSG